MQEKRLGRRRHLGMSMREKARRVECALFFNAPSEGPQKLAIPGVRK